jgi:twitching motility protein PilT
MPYNINELLAAVIRFDGSDLVLKAGSPPLFRVYGDLHPINAEPLTHDSVADLIETLLNSRQSEIFHRDLELDFSHELPGVSRYRVNVFQQRGNMGLVARAIPYRIRTDGGDRGAARVPRVLRAPARAGARYRPDRVRQVHDARRND